MTEVIKFPKKEHARACAKLKTLLEVLRFAATDKDSIELRKLFRPIYHTEVGGMMYTYVDGYCSGLLLGVVDGLSDSDIADLFEGSDFTELVDMAHADYQEDRSFTLTIPLRPYTVTIIMFRLGTTWVLLDYLHNEVSMRHQAMVDIKEKYNVDATQMFNIDGNESDK